MAILETEIESGKVRGALSGYQRAAVYRGIPYAKAPVGSLRWKAPQPIEHWEGTRDCWQFGPMPYQAVPDKPIPGREVIGMDRELFGLPMSEDCLYLNVWTAAETKDAKLPVVLWFFGGGYMGGRGHEAFLDGDQYCKRGVIFVSANYRVNIFGFFCHPQLAKEDAHHSSGNYGVMDQMAALDWVRKNIASFGGDPDQICLMGLSAGSRSVQNLCLAPMCRGKFKRAIHMSGAGMGSWQSLMRWDLETAGAVGKEFLRRAGIRDIKEAREMSAEAIFAEFTRQKKDYLGWKVMRPCIDGYLFHKPFLELYREKQFADVDYMIGVTADENDGFYKNPDPDDIPAFVEMMEKNYGEKADEMLEAYGLGEEEKMKANILRFRTDDLRAAALSFCEFLTANDDRAPYLYYFDHVPKGNPEGVGAYHGMDEIYALGSLHRSERRYEGEDYEISNRMADYFTNFIRKGNPNAAGLPEWEAYRHGERNAMTFAHGGGMKQVPVNDVVNYKISTSLGLQ